MIILQIFLASIFLWLMYIPTANLVNRNRRKEFTGITRLLVTAWVYTFVLVDLIYNYTYGALLFWEFASNDRKLLTARLKYYLQTQPGTWRGELSFFFCTKLIEPFDPNHCSLSE